MINRAKLIQKLQAWLLAIAICIGCIVYAAFHYLSFLLPLKPYVNLGLEYVVPWLIFIMLFVSFCKVDVKQMRPRKWHAVLLIIQFVLSVFFIFMIRTSSSDAVVYTLEGVLVCVIIPTAAAAAVITGKLGGNESSLTSYMIMSNMSSAVLIPFLFPFITDNGSGFIEDFLQILPRVFPMIVLPFVTALAVKYYVPKFHYFIVTKCKNLAFYIWATTTITITGEVLRSIVNSKEDGSFLLFLALVSLIVCFIQFCVGKIVGHFFGQRISAGQAFGQKNMVFGVWVALSYLAPTAAISPGCYVLWQNLVNSFQLWYRDKWNERLQKQGKPPYQE